MRRFVQAFTREALPAGLPPGIVDALLEAPARYNVAQRKPAVVIFDHGDGIAAGDFQWGLVPAWSAAPETKYTTVTARLERAPSSRVFRRPWERQRCAVPMTGYYKWDRRARPPRPYFIQPRSGDVLFAAGLWDRWDKGEPPLSSFAILTHPNRAIPPPLVQDGPLFLPAARIAEWIAGPAQATRFLTATTQPALEAYEVSRRIRSREVDDYTLLEPATAVEDIGVGLPEPTDAEWMDSLDEDA